MRKESKNFDGGIKKFKETLCDLTTTYFVPKYQRQYAWDIEKIEQLWEDLEYLEEERIGDHFFGLMLFKKIDEGFEIIDGQQRIATATILFAVISDLFSELKLMEQAKGLQNIVATIQSTGQKPRIILNLKNREFFEKNIQMPKNRKKNILANLKNKEPSNEKIALAYKYFYEKIKEKLNKIKLKEGKKEYLLSVQENVENFVVNRIEVTDETDAYMVFETLNNRGLRLSTIDLIKNYIFSRSSEQDLPTIQRKWVEIYDRVGSRKMNNFIRYFWIAAKMFVREKQLFKELKKTANKPAKVKTLVLELEEYSLIFEKLLSPKTEDWNGDNELVKNLKVLFKTLRIQQATPLFLLAAKKLNTKKLNDLAVNCIKLSFRYSTICGKNTNSLERTYATIADNLRSNKKNMNAIDKILKTQNPKNKEFIQDFQKKKIDNQLAKYILSEIENKKSKKTEVEVKDILTVEHLLPQNPGNWWQTQIENNIISTDFTKLLGNLTLVEPEVNSTKLKNKPFPDKQKIIKEKSDLWINKSVVKAKGWTNKELEKRQNKLLNVAKQVWKY